MARHQILFFGHWYTGLLHLALDQEKNVRFVYAQYFEPTCKDNNRVQSMNKGRSVFWLYTKEEIKNIIDSSNTIKEVIEKFGEKDVGGKRKTFFNICKYYDIKLDELRNRSKIYVESIKKQNLKMKQDMNIGDYFIENSKVARKNIKRYIIKNNLKDYKCEKCGNNGYWQNLELTLHLEHKNGINNDNRLENLTFLCPNCHSQTDTYSGRKASYSLSKEEFSKINKQENILKFKKRLEQIKDIDLSKRGWVEKVANIWGVSHTQVKRLFKKYYNAL